MGEGDIDILQKKESIIINMNGKLPKRSCPLDLFITKTLKDFFRNNKFNRSLDISSGVGNASYYLRGYSSMLHCVDLDKYLDMFTLKKYYKKIHFVKYDGKHIPYKDNAFNLVYSFDVIEHLNNYNLLTHEAICVLAKNGYLIIGTPNVNRIGNILLRLFYKLKFPRKLGNSYYGECIHIKELSDKELQSIFSDIAQIKHIKSFYVGFGLVNFTLPKPPNFLNRYCNYLLSIYQKIS